jgi:tRNA threonylcarbamoyl adenosine modification protein YeaZ
MKILALELSAGIRSVAAWDSESGLCATATETHTRHTRLFALMEQAMQSAKWSPEMVDGLAVGLGPGSYTGIRMAIAAALGWQAVRPVQLWGVSSFHVMAEGLWRAGRRGDFFLAVDAQRHEACFAGFHLQPSGWVEGAPLQLLPQSEVIQRVESGAKVLGPDIRRWCPLAEEWQPSAADLARLAATACPLANPSALAPIYLREARFAKAPPPRIIKDL